jgi:hypothetical protein
MLMKTVVPEVNMFGTEYKWSYKKNQFCYMLIKTIVLEVNMDDTEYRTHVNI